MDIEQIAELYNNPETRVQLEARGTGVSETEDSIYRRRRDSSILAVDLAATTNFSYRVVDGQYLVPKDGLTLNPMNFDTFQSLFEVNGFQPGDRPGVELAIASPAKVAVNGDGTFSLIEKGRFLGPSESLDLPQNSDRSEATMPASESAVEVPLSESPAFSANPEQQQYMQLLGLPVSDYERLRATGDRDVLQANDRAVVDAASRMELSPERLTQLIENAPYSQRLQDQGSNPSDYVRSLVAPYESAQRNADLERLSESLDTKPSTLFMPVVAQAHNTLAEAARAGYQALASTEKVFFALTPLPLNALKSGFQQVAVPLFTTAIAAKVPGVQQAIATAVDLGGSFVSTASVAIAGNALAHFGQSVMSNLPTGLGVQTVAQGLGNAIAPLVMGAADRGGQWLGEGAVAVLTGNAILKGGSALAQQMSDKGPKVLLAETVRMAQQAIGRARALTDRIQTMVSHLRSQNSAISQEDLGMNDNNGFSPDPQNIPEQAEFEAPERIPPQRSEPIPEPVGRQETVGENEWFEPSQEPAVQQETFEAAIEQPSLEPAAKEEASQTSMTFDELKQAELSKENMDYALSLEQQLSQRNIDTQRLEIFYDGQNQFKMKDYGVTQNRLGNEAVEMLKQALNDPAALQGEVMIKQGSKVLLHVKDGQVLRDPLRMVTEAAKVEINTPTQALYEKSAAGVTSKGLQQVSDVSKNAFRSGADLEQTMDMNRRYNPEYKVMAEKVGETAVNEVIRSAKNKVAIEQNPQIANQPKNTVQRGMG